MSGSGPKAALRTFAEFWADHARTTPCCQFASDDELETDSDAYDCETCPVAAALESLDEANREAWRMFGILNSRFLADLHAGGVALEKLTADLDAEMFEDLIERLRMLYDTLSPAPVIPSTET